MVLQDCNTLLEAILTLVTVKSKLKTMNDLYMDLLNYFTFAFALDLGLLIVLLGVGCFFLFLACVQPWFYLALCLA